MNNKGLGILALLLTLIGAIIAIIVFFMPGAVPKLQDEEKGEEIVADVSMHRELPPIQQELNDLSSKMVAQLKSEERLNLNMVAQLRSYQEMMRQVEGYAFEIEKNLDMIEEISRDEFQEDVKLQASLFSGKKPDLVAKHLEEYRASRVGAILAKMKQKEASVVLDTWAEQDDVKVAAFYREVMAAFLNNKRRDANPELFNRLGEEAAVADRASKQRPPVR